MHPAEQAEFCLSRIYGRDGFVLACHVCVQTLTVAVSDDTDTAVILANITEAEIDGWLFHWTRAPHRPQAAWLCPTCARLLNRGKEL